MIVGVSECRGAGVDGWEWVRGGVEESSGGGEEWWWRGGGLEGGGGRFCLLGRVGWRGVMH